MGFYVQKLIITTVMVVLISEIAKRYSMIGAILASLPIVSILAIIWLYHETHDLNRISAFSSNIFWLVIPSLVFFVALPWLIQLKWGFYPALFGAGFLTVICYFLAIIVLKYFELTD
ncbi:DUF3147 family protein [Litoribrevibacter euphylliae]|uniref:DUF3147 family protein n=1 Tax=Litoribrevibacter euphylliae TaxID=1834034 RepID=A0ABV7HCP5_9GAMM